MLCVVTQQDVVVVLSSTAKFLCAPELHFAHPPLNFMLFDAYTNI